MRALENRKPDNRPSSPFFEPKIQKKLKTGTAGDQFEIEADKVADQVTKNPSAGGGLLQSKEEVQRKPISETISSVQAKDMKEEEKPVQKKSDKKEEEKPVQKKSDKKEEEKPVQKKSDKKEEEKPVQKKSDKKEDEKPVQKKSDKKEEEKPVQKKCDDCEKEEKVQKKDKKEEEKPVQKKGENSDSEIENNELEGKLDRSKGSGKSLDEKTKGEMESGFGTDFGSVKIHTDSNAVQMSQELGAQAFTSGNDVYFNNGKYNPDSKEGKHLLAHELTHTVQQTGAKQKTPAIQKSAIENHHEDLRAQQPENPQFKGNTNLEKANDDEMLISTGQKGPAVTELQKGLMQTGQNLNNFGADGDFGSETRNAVIDFQGKNGLDVDGVVGPQTIGTLDNILIGDGKKDKKKPPKKCKRKEPVIVKRETFSGLMTVVFFAESGCKNTVIIKSRNLRDNSEVGGCSAFDVVIDGFLKAVVNPAFGKDTITTIPMPGISEGRHDMTLSVSAACFATVDATVSVF